MKKSALFLLSVFVSSSYAAQNTTSLDSYTSRNYTVASPNQIIDSLTKLQNEVTQLKYKVAEQSQVISDLKARQAKLESAGLTSSSNYAQPAKLSGSPSAANYHDGTKASAGEKSRYEYAYSIFRSGNYDQALAEFQAIIKDYPNGEYADNSQYWTGEALLKKGEKRKAMQAFDRVIYAYPNSPKVPDALLKLGMTQLSIGNKSKAKEYFDYLIGTYPGTPSANIGHTKKLQAGL